MVNNFVTGLSLESCTPSCTIYSPWLSASGRWHAASIICTDKTGELTHNEMMVTSIITQNLIFTIDGAGYEPKGSFSLADQPVDASTQPALLELGRAAGMYNDAVLRQHEDLWITVADGLQAGHTLTTSVFMPLKDEFRKGIKSCPELVDHDNAAMSVHTSLSPPW